MTEGERSGAHRRRPRRPPTAPQWEPIEYDEDGLIDGLEPDQLVEVTARPVPLADLGPRARAGLWLLRIFTLVVGAMVIYTFIYGTIHGTG